MAQYTQSNRPLRVSTPLGPDKLLLAGFEGQEAVSRLFRYTLDLRSEDRAVDTASLLRKPVTLEIELPDGSTRFINGMVSRFACIGYDEMHARFEAEIVPWFWFLTLARDSRIFQNKTVPEIVDAVFSAAGYKDFRFEMRGSYPQREYCVQYRESAFDFVSRLLEEEGITYFFEHDDAKHTMVLLDDNSSFKDIDGPTAARFGIPAFTETHEPIVEVLRTEDSVFAGRVTLQDYDPEKPSFNLLRSISGAGVEEVFDYPGRYRDPGLGERLARVRLEAEEAGRHIVRGSGHRSCHALAAGRAFTLAEHFLPAANRKYALLEVDVRAVNGDITGAESITYQYDCSFLAIPYDTPYRAPARTPKPVVRGSQTAVVVGPAGEEIWVDKYGRVIVQFHWDRVGEHNEKSSCWVRVSSGWAGKGWGVIQHPRIGQEVIVDFLEGDPDFPIITGRVYNAEQVHPYDLPATKTQSGIKSRSSPGGSTETFNEIRMEDKAGEEQLYVHAQRNHDVMVELDRTLTVGQDEKVTIKRDRVEEVGRDETITIKQHRTEQVDGNETITIKGNRETGIDGNDILGVEGDSSIDISKGRTLAVGKDLAVTVKGKRTVTIKGSDALDVTQKLTIESKASIELKCGSSSIKIDPSGVTIKGTMVKVEGTAMAQVKSPMTTVKGDTIVQVKGGTMGKVEGGAVLMVKGGVAMIN
jgi:type VI secretion system secreted protein VgrG